MTDDNLSGLAAFVAGNDDPGAPLTRESVDAALARMRDAGRTHWDDCWRDRHHHACAVDQVERAQVAAEHWRARYMAAHEILLLVEQLIESGAYTSERAGTIAIDWRPYERVRDAFLAYRQSIEAGAPLAWAVLEQEVAG